MKDSFFLPDVMTVCDKDGIKDDGIHTVPRFVAEVTSESSRKRDFYDKLIVYVKMGVQEYWVVDLQDRRVVRYLASDDYIPDEFRGPSVPAHTCPGMEIELF